MRKSCGAWMSEASVPKIPFDLEIQGGSVVIVIRKGYKTPELLDLMRSIMVTKSFIVNPNGPNST
jgi:hypothetical protein